MFVEGVGNLARVTDRGVNYFHFLYYLFFFFFFLKTRREVVSSPPSPSTFSFGLNKTIVIIGCLRQWFSLYC